MADLPNILHGGIRDTRLLERAIRERWPMPSEAVRAAIMNRQATEALKPGNSPRETASAAKTLLMADRLNLEAEKGEPVEQHLHLHQHEANTGTRPLANATDAELLELEARLLELKARQQSV